MSFLKRQSKNVLLLLAAEFDTDVSRDLKVKEIVAAITGASDYDEEDAKAYLERILREAEEEKGEKQREIERQEKDKEREIERQLREKEIENQFELEKIKLQTVAETSSLASTVSTQEIPAKKSNLKDLVPKFDPKQIDVTLFFTIFERQARKENITEQNWVSQLIPLLPVDIAQIVIKIPEDKADDFQHVKQVLFNRFKLSARALRNKFENHFKKQDELWVDLVYELRSYMQNWLDTLEVKSFDSLKELMLTEQLKKRVPIEVKEHFLDVWDDLNEASILAEKCDKFESVRKENRRWEPRSVARSSFKKNKGGQNVSKMGKDQKYGAGKTDKKDGTESIEKKIENNEKNFDRQSKVICFLCGERGHIKPYCDKNPNRRTPINNLNAGDLLSPGFQPYLGKAVINGQVRDYLRDSGSDIDVCESDMISVEDLLPEQVWVKQPFEAGLKALALAKITLEGDFGSIVTKAAVRPSELNQGLYLLGNRSAKLIEQLGGKIHPINAITRSQFQKINAEKGKKNETTESLENKPRFRESKTDKDLVNEKEGEKGEGINATSSITKDEIVIPALSVTERSPLVKISSEEFRRAQKDCPTLKELWKRVGNEKEKEFGLEKDCLVRYSDSKRGKSKVQLCVPEIYQSEILSLCHDSVSGHLGSCKTKDRVLNNFFWPNCYQKIEQYVKTCLKCQKVGKPNDKKKAPLKIVPIISETFRKLSIDVIGPLIVSNKNNRYALTAVCEASKFPDAIAIENLSSKAVIHALMQIFAKIGFPKEVQCDLGTSFTSELTTAFFNKYDIKVSHSSVCHPQSNQVERLHSTLKRILKALCLESKSDWEENLPMALFALRTVTHASTGFSPAELVYGKNLRMPHTIVFENWMQDEEISQNVVDYILDLNERLKKCQDLAVERMSECQKKRKLWYDKNAVLRKFKVGDPVLVLATARPHKMSVQWLGPGVVTGVISDTNYTVDLPEKKSKDTIYHVNLMKPYHKRPEHVNLIIERGCEEIEDEASIPYPVADPNYFDLNELIKNSNIGERVTEENLGALQNLLVKHKRVFSNDPGNTSLVEMDIILTEEKPIRAKPYRMSPRQLEIMRNEIKRLLELGIIEVGQSDYASPMILVESPGKAPRPCVDYRALNGKTQVEFFPLPNIEEVVEKVSAASFISVMDLTKGYYQIPLTKRAQRYAAFVTPFGEFIPKKMMFGLVNAPFYFCKLISLVLGDLSTYALPYIDDIAVYSQNWESHIKHLDTVLKRLGEANLKVKPSKCSFAQGYVRFLGHEVGSGKRSPSEAKIKAIHEFQIPKTKTQLRSFLGLTGFYQKFIGHYATKAAPLTDLLKGKNRREKIDWNEACDKAFKLLKEELTRSPVLFSPDFSREFIVQADASLVGAGVVLAQKFEDGSEHPIVYLSKKFTSAERNYSTIERELAAIVFGVKKLNHYLDGQKFVLQTDHNPLSYLKRMTASNARLTRWALCLQQYNFTVVYKRGKNHSNADALSRIYVDC